jgi:hypothetical protein
MTYPDPRRPDPSYPAEPARHPYPPHLPATQPWPSQPQFGDPGRGTAAYPPPQPGYLPPFGSPPPAGHGPHAGRTRGPKRRRRWPFVVLGVVVAAGLCGVGAVLISAGTHPGGNAGTTSAGGAGAVAAGLNQAARDGKFEFVVKSVSCGKASEGDVLSKTAQGQFCEVSVTVRNIGTRPQTFDGGNQKAKGVNGATYGDDTEAELYANNDNQTFLTDINPGNTVSGVLVFDIPKTGRIASLELHDSPFSGGVTVTVG